MMIGDELAEMAAWAEARVPRLIDEVCDATVERIPFYRDKSAVPAEELRRAVEQNLRFLVTAIGNPQAPLDLAAPEETGRRRARQGAPLPEVLQCYRICFTTLWDALVARARDERRPAATETLLTTAGLIFRLIDQHALALTEAYRAATAEMLLAQQQRRSALVEALLAGHPSPDAGPWEAATLLGLPSDGELIVVAADTRGLAEASLPDVERRLGAQGIASGWRLTPAQQLGIVSLNAETWIALLRPSFHLRALEADETPLGYLGGDPLLPADLEWPVWEGHGPLGFIAAVDCARVPTPDLDIPFPESGTLLFFYFDGLGESSVAYTDPDSVVNGTRVIHVPAGTSPFPRLELDAEGVGFWDELTAFRRDHWPHHRIGGYALPVQGAVEPEGAQVFHPGKEEQAEAARKELAADLVLLAQIDSDSRSGMGWGDAGRLYWMIRREDLAAGRFDRATFTWQCE